MSDWYISSTAWTAIAQFAASHAYVVGNIVRPLTTPAAGREYAFRCTTAGTSSTEPTWPVANNATVTTGGATFTNVSGQSTYNWTAAAGTLYSIANANSNRPVAGDRVYLSSDHSETFTSLTYAFSSAGFGLIQIISVNRAGTVPPVAADVLAGAALTFNAATQTIQIDPLVDMFWQGLTFTFSGATANTLQFGTTGLKSHYFKNCAFVFSTSAATGRIISGLAAKVIFDNTTVQFGAATHAIGVGSAAPFELIWLNTPSAISGTAPTTLFASASTGGNLFTCRGVDFSAVTGTLITALTTTSGTKLLLDSCKIASAVTRLGGTATLAGDEVELINCFDGTNTVNERHTWAGDVTVDRTTYLTGGAQDDTGNYSLKLISSSRTDKFTFTLDSFWLDVENTATGSSKTATVEIISSGTLNNDDISLLLEYMGTAGSSVASFVSSLPATPLTTASALTSSSSTWNSPPGTPQKQLLQVTFTPQVAGRVRGLVKLGKISTTVWVNPQIIIT